MVFFEHHTQFNVDVFHLSQIQFKNDDHAVYIRFRWVTTTCLRWKPQPVTLWLYPVKSSPSTTSWLTSVTRTIWHQESSTLRLTAWTFSPRPSKVVSGAWLTYIDSYRNQDVISGLMLDPTSGPNMQDPQWVSQFQRLRSYIVMELRQGNQALVKIETKGINSYPRTGFPSFSGLRMWETVPLEIFVRK